MARMGAMQLLYHWGPIIRHDGKPQRVIEIEICYRGNNSEHSVLRTTRCEM